MSVTIAPLALAAQFALVFASSLGAPGGIITMLSAGALANNYADLSLLIIVSVVGAILGDLIAYWLARRFSEPLSRRLHRYKTYRDNEPKVRDELNRAIFPIVFFTRWFLTGLGTVVNFVSGLERIDRKKFIIAVVPGELIYGSLYPALGFIFKETWTDLAPVITDAIALSILVVVTVIIVRRMRQKA